MTHNVFKFGDTFWLQLSGTAMGTPPAPAYATLYFAIHEIYFVQHFPELRYYCRYLDDCLGIWVGNQDDRWLRFQRELNEYGSLDWTTTPLSDEVTFLDLTISQNQDGVIETQMFEKNLNAYLYLPPHSAHAPGVLKGLIIGMLVRIVRLTTNTSHINDCIRRFYKRLINRGYKQHRIAELFNTTIDAINTKLQLFSNNPTGDDLFSINDQPVTEIRDTILLHLRYHPHDPPSQHFQQLFRNIVNFPLNGQPLSAIENLFGNPCGFNRLIVAFSRHLNLGNHLSVRKFHNPSNPVSNIIRQRHPSPHNAF
jgi:hypothetical protein